MGYSRKDNAKASLSKLIEGVDFLLLKAQEQTAGRGGDPAWISEGHEHRSALRSLRGRQLQIDLRQHQLSGRWHQGCRVAK